MPNPNANRAPGAMLKMKPNLCFIALEITSMYILKNRRPPLASNKPMIKRPTIVATSALLFSDSSFKPFFVSRIETNTGPESMIKSKAKNDGSRLPNPALESLRANAIG